MTHPMLTLTLVITMTFFAAGVVKGISGVGLPTLAMGVLAVLYSPGIAAALLLMPSFVTNVWQLLAGPSLRKLVWRLWPMLLMILIGTLVGSTTLASSHSQNSGTGLGGLLVIYSTYALLGRPLRLPSSWERPLSPLVGLIAGLVTGTTGVFVFPAVPYLQSLGLERDDLVQALGLSFTVSTLALAALLQLNGAALSGHMLASILAIIPTLLGMAIGQIVRSRISPELFRRLFHIVLLLLGSGMIVHAVV